MSVVCVCGGGGGAARGGWGGENVSHAVHAALGGCVVCVCRGGGGRSRGSHAINTHTAQKQ